MEMRLRKVRRQARQALRGRLWQTGVVFLLWAVTWGAVSLGDRAVFYFAGERLGWSGGGGTPAGGWLSAASGTLWVTLATAAVRAILLTPLRAGATAWFAALADGWTRPLGTLFWPYGNRVWLRSLVVRLYTGLLTGAVTLVPLAGLGVSLWLLRERLARLPPRELAVAVSVAGVSAALWLLMARAYSQRFSMAVFLLGPDHGYTAAGAIRRSEQYTRGHRWRLVGLDLSFLPWFAACLLVFPIPYVLPYYAASRARYFSYLARLRSRPTGVREAARSGRPRQHSDNRERVTTYGKEHRV